MNVSEQIRNYRTEHQLSQKALAEILGVTQPAITYYESGRIPRGEVAYRLHQLDPERFQLKELLCP